MPIAKNGLNLKIPEFPIVKKIEETESGKIVVTIELDFKMLNGIYTAEIEIVEQQPYEHIRLRSYHKSGLGRLAIDLNITIEPIDIRSHIATLDGILEVKGLIRMMGSKTLHNGVSNGIELILGYLDKKLGKGDQENIYEEE